ncbi:MAG: hypothetical protein H6Q89_83 [Myxococcaceae bacterium]|nr:hypothetical protein [Myxococcaceae bacterium]
MRWLLALMAVVGLVAAGFFLGSRLPPQAPSPTVVERLRAVSRLQVLDVSVTRKVTLQPDPVDQPTVTGALVQWARYAVAPPSGTALVTAEAHFAIDLSKLPPDAVSVQGERVELTLPEAEVSIELTPAQTEVVVSNLDSQQTTALLAKAQVELGQSLARDPRLREKARVAAERALGAVVLALGFKEVRFNQPVGPPVPAPAR